MGAMGPLHSGTPLRKPGCCIERVAECDGMLVGFGFIGAPLGGEAPRARHLYIFYVLESHHGTGIGQALLDTVLGREPAMLWVAK